MGALSTPAPTQPDSDAQRRSPGEIVLFVVIPVATALVFMAVLVGEGTSVDTDLQLILPSQAAAGQSIAIRAFHMDDLDRPEGPELLNEPVDVRATDGSGRIVARARLRSSAVAGLEGVLNLPADASDELAVHARSRAGQDRISIVRAPLVVSSRPDSRAARPRLTMPLQRYTAFPIRRAGASAPPSHLELRVVGGACIPEQPCRLLVLVGRPAAVLELDPTGMITPVSVPAEPTEGIAALTVVTHGPEADLDLVARRDGEVVGRRLWRLPVLLGMPSVDVADVLPRAPARLRVRLRGAERPLIVDGFREGLWERTGSLAVGEGEERSRALPFAPLSPGLWRVQLRADAFGVDSAVARMVYVMGATEGEADAFEAIRDRAEGWDDPLARTIGALEPDSRLATAFLLSLPELDVVDQPPAMSGHMQAASGLDQTRVHLRWAGAATFVLAGLFAFVMVLRRGLAAGAQARALLAGAGDPEAQSRARRWRMTLTVVAVASAVALAFVAAAAILIARGGV